MALLRLLTDKTLGIPDVAYENAVRAELETIFPKEKWELTLVVKPYTDENKANLYKTELRKGIKNALTAAGKSEADFRKWLGDVHYVNVAAVPKAILEKSKGNEGWRFSMMGIPAANVAAMGIASHYQGGQDHINLGRASALLHELVRDGLADTGRSALGRAVDPADWDKTGLVVRPITQVLGLTIPSDVDDGKLAIKNVRSTTVKRILASFISVEAIDPKAAEQQLFDRMKEWADQAWMLASEISPFTSVQDFEFMRTLAMTDQIAARQRIRLRKKSATRSIVRIYYGPPGTGKTLTAVREAVRQVDPLFDDVGDASKAFARFNDLTDQVAFITFHQALQYEDAIESIRPVIESPQATVEIDSADIDADEEPSTAEIRSAAVSTSLGFRLHEGVLLRMIRAALEQPNKEFVVVIDEINRGDISRILGPLISSLEPDKRLGAEYPIGIELQYPRAETLESRLFLPANIHFMGTMNSADRNIALVDHALRRRFEFILVPPEPEMLRATSDADPIDLRALLNTLNGRVSHLMGAEYSIGHGYFMACTTNDDVIRVMARKVIPLLAEYFYGNSSLLLLVLSEDPTGDTNIHLVSAPDLAYEKLFNLNRDTAKSLGYRPHEANAALRFDPRFWDDAKSAPAPGDVEYAVRAIQKIYKPTTAGALLT
ncbi:5-methylcytosine-specific restriction protein B [Rhizobium leguminosarum]|uniref:5-methylcytosine-specific restriction protein B n=1 Tax=Rhizobium leguminosarum TaxID=384 RepID=A0AAE2MLQ7_RHILE|nr:MULTISPECIES: AAA family ATPase [Rhizobium]MBB4291440.1 5-methylcytosine-specific restriction protein B [Rhizobium leguminosarum]MBB4296136.1 5-methylcytosine-specific restriction protein B [Rhizobium leguminosarum]MBB4308605.1 5-methylcytosine-specific restriction protein B [Rhizobium leguminosarum]MBB4416440.1 5-methylcytosine-specific restriction protein B [Rhizobium leguminosarum]MBB4430593.1 5-methylcytosine-specific restriction protein B [Rhizobium esperanzae]